MILRPSVRSPSNSGVCLWGLSSKPQSQLRCATFLRRPRRPYTFTQLVTLSDGSTYTHRTTSPAPVYRSTKDTRNTPLWNPSSQKLLSAESDIDGRLRRFREKFGRGWDATRQGDREGTAQENLEFGQDGGRSGGQPGGKARSPDEEDNVMDLISGYGRQAEGQGEAAGVREEKTRSGKKTGGEK